ncbi:hypothetical protein GF395_02540 [Candidatus Uhrbacteria bacterium]|nr:hypothetical protein [Candidatus Uhrbacteria bacterium]
MLTACPPPERNNDIKRFGCLAATPGFWGGNKNAEISLRKTTSKAEAVTEAQDAYLREHPNVKNPNVNCWDCSKPGLDAKAKEICE